MRLLAIIVLLLSNLAYSGEKFAPLPEQILSAKTVYIDNQSPFAEVADAAYREISKQGRFTVVTSPEKADLVFVFSDALLPGKTVTTGTVIGHSVIAKTSPSNKHCSITLAVHNQKRERLWANTKDGNRTGATEKVLRDLKLRIEQR